MLSAHAHIAPEYYLNITQQPSQACQVHGPGRKGGKKSSEFIDPPVVVELRDRSIRDPRLGLNNHFLRLFASLEFQKTDEHGAPIGEPAQCHSLRGERFVTPQPLRFRPCSASKDIIGSHTPFCKDRDHREAAVFVFSELKCHVKPDELCGRFRLKFHLFELDFQDLGMPAHAHGVGMVHRAVEYSRYFTVFAPREYPGTTESTELIGWLNKQGIDVQKHRPSKGQKHSMASGESSAAFFSQPSIMGTPFSNLYSMNGSSSSHLARPGGRPVPDSEEEKAKRMRLNNGGRGTYQSIVSSSPTIGDNHGLAGMPIRANNYINGGLAAPWSLNRSTGNLAAPTSTFVGQLGTTGYQTHGIAGLGQVTTPEVIGLGMSSAVTGGMPQRHPILPLHLRQALSVGWTMPTTMSQPSSQGLTGMMGSAEVPPPLGTNSLGMASLQNAQTVAPHSFPDLTPTQGPVLDSLLAMGLDHPAAQHDTAEFNDEDDMNLRVALDPIVTGASQSASEPKRPRDAQLQGGWVDVSSFPFGF
ncbi:hypothetical protein GQ53DRAFT_774708 [Thozetella sp. PMI_491]|nr:hypothetical protein GQ53DRAFT_774708 [Thozetella sp. PMI_491]